MVGNQMRRMTTLEFKTVQKAVGGNHYLFLRKINFNAWLTIINERVRHFQSPGNEKDIFTRI